MHLLKDNFDPTEAIRQLSLHQEISEDLFCEDCFRPILALSHLAKFLDHVPELTLQRLIPSETSFLVSDSFDRDNIHELSLIKVTKELKDTHDHCCRTGILVLIFLG